MTALSSLLYEVYIYLKLLNDISFTLFTCARTHGYCRKQRFEIHCSYLCASGMLHQISPHKNKSVLCEAVANLSVHLSQSMADIAHITRRLSDATPTGSNLCGPGPRGRLSYPDKIPAMSCIPSSAILTLKAASSPHADSKLSDSKQVTRGDSYTAGLASEEKLNFPFRYYLPISKWSLRD